MSKVTARRDLNREIIKLALGRKSEPREMISAVAEYVTPRRFVDWTHYGARADAYQRDIDAIQDDLDSDDPDRVRDRVGTLRLPVVKGVKQSATFFDGQWWLHAAGRQDYGAAGDRLSQTLDAYARVLLSEVVSGLDKQRLETKLMHASHPHPSRMSEHKLKGMIRKLAASDNKTDAKSAVVAAINLILRRLSAAGYPAPWGDIYAEKRRQQELRRCRRAVSRLTAA